jgi:hypothetical protein
MAKKNYKYRKIKNCSTVYYSKNNTEFTYQKRCSLKSTSILYSAIKVALQNRKIIIAVPYKERIWALENSLKKIVFDFANNFSKEDQKLIKKNIIFETPSYFLHEKYRGTFSPHKKGSLFIDECDEFFSKFAKNSIDEIVFNFNIEKAVGTPVDFYNSKMNYVHKKLGLKKRKLFLHKALKEPEYLTKSYVDRVITPLFVEEGSFWTRIANPAFL